MKRKILPLLLLLAMTVSAVGCSGQQTSDKQNDVTIEGLAAEVSEKEEDIASINLNLDFKVKVGMSMGEDAGSPVETDIHSTGTVETFIKPEIKSKSKMIMEMNMMGMSIPVITEQYIVMQDGKYVAYVQTEGEEWTKTEVSADVVTPQSQNDLKIFRAVQEGKLTGTLADTMEQVNGKDCYVVDVEVTGDYVRDMVSQILDQVTGSTDADWSKASTNVRYYIDASEKLPAKMSINMGDMVSEVFAGVDLGTDIQVSECTVDIVFNSYNSVEDFQLPADAAKAKDAGELVNDLLKG